MKVILFLNLTLKQYRAKWGSKIGPHPGGLHQGLVIERFQDNSGSLTYFTAQILII
ncbi:hypothetical protein MARINOS108_10931 [Marinoscillum sp. 108]|nr:hypothetical protein MARINOS108_10931 [Marinoscillum sp. 108]